ncbi:uncharacterized protein At2g29880-like [Gossypium raimondii]|uniref:uncharacterized protein At2g29880-like n=1 Tax=Gossypium raimondii TaxID=29730 RepID=UPI00227A0F31|nr:uncharacterized protein At2g29880-like [Gossypium raimondii]
MLFYSLPKSRITLLRPASLPKSLFYPPSLPEIDLHPLLFLSSSFPLPFPLLQFFSRSRRLVFEVFCSNTSSSQSSPICSLQIIMSGVPQSYASSQASRGTKIKWVPEEDAALVSCMVDLHNVRTFNADTGFKAGYLNELEKMLEKALPNAMLKAKPNIESRIRLLKREWSIVYDMLNDQKNSGFGWDEHRQLVVAEDAVWDSYLKSHKEAAQFRHRTFPYYDQLTAIYARDQATGKDAQSAADVLQEINTEDVSTTDMNEERNTFYDCEADVSLDDMDVSGTKPQ